MRNPLLRFFIVFSLVLLVLTACDHNVYMGEPEKVDGLWKVNGIYFDSLQEAMDYIYGDTKGIDNSKAIDDVPVTRIAVLQRNVMNGERGGGLIVPADFEGQLVIDFNGFTYEFDDSLDHFFDVRGGDEVYIINGTTVIYNEASHVPFAIAVNTDTVKIDSHLIDDRRWDPTLNQSDAKLFDVGPKGTLVVEGIPAADDNAYLRGVISVTTDGERGGKLTLSDSRVVVTNIITGYLDNDTGEYSSKIPGDIADTARTEIEISSGYVTINNIETLFDYYKKEGTAPAELYSKAILNIFSDDATKLTKIENPHDDTDNPIDSAIQTIIDDQNTVTDPDVDHVIIHNFSEWIVVTEPTCTVAGTERRTCSFCSLNEYREIRALGHLITTGWVTTDPVTHWHVCDRCSENVGEEAHSFSEWTYDSVSRQSVRDCSVCSRHESETHVHTLTHVPKVSHTATTPGIIEYWYCTVCNKKYSDEAGTIQVTDVADPHKLTEHPANAHTCTADGNYQYWQCDVCGLYFSDSLAHNQITYEQTIDPASHTLDYVEKVSPSCTEPGTKAHYRCSVCEKLFSDYTGKTEVSESDLVIDATGHTPGDWNTTDTEHYKICSICNEIVDEGSHSHSTEEWQHSATNHYLKCDVCSYHMDEAEHAFGEWVVGETVKTRTCTVCGYVDEEPIGHTHTLEHHSAKAATCTEDGNIEYWYCSGCGKYFSDSQAQTQVSQESTVIEKINHKNSVIHEAVEGTCTVNGHIRYWSCPDCNRHFASYSAQSGYSDEIHAENLEKLVADGGVVIAAKGHEYSAWTRTTAPTCTHKGTDTRTCTRNCGEEGAVQTKDVDALGHSFGEWVVTTAPTCETAGEKTRTCTRECGEEGATETESIAALGHDWSTVWSTDGTYHWHVCQRTGCTAVNDKAEHTILYTYSYEDEILDIERKCSVCEFIKTDEIEDEDGVFRMDIFADDQLSVTTVEESGVNVIQVSIINTSGISDIHWYNNANGQIVDYLDGLTTIKVKSTGIYSFYCKYKDELKITRTLLVQFKKRV